MSASLDYKIDYSKLRTATDRGKRLAFKRAAFLVRQEAVSSIERAEGPSPPGQPPHTHRRTFLRRAIRYAADKDGAVIGPRFDVFGEAGVAHEFGGEYKGQTYPKRPFMLPALIETSDDFARAWAGVITA